MVLGFIDVIREITGENYVLHQHSDNCYDLWIRTDTGALYEGKYGINIGLTMKEMYCCLRGLIKGLNIK